MSLHPGYQEIHPISRKLFCCCCPSWIPGLLSVFVLVVHPGFREIVLLLLSLLDSRSVVLGERCKWPGRSSILSGLKVITCFAQVASNLFTYCNCLLPGQAFCCWTWFPGALDTIFLNSHCFYIVFIVCQVDTQHSLNQELAIIAVTSRYEHRVLQSLPFVWGSQQLHVCMVWLKANLL